MACMRRTSRSRRPCARGEVLCTEPGRPHPCPAGHAGPAHEGKSRTMSMHADEESDEGVVPMKRSNNEGVSSAETVEGRTSPKGNGGQTAAARTLRRDTASNGLAAVRRAAQQSKTVRFTALLHHITTDLLKRSYLALARDAAPGIDGVTWQAYGETLEETEGPARPSASWQLSGTPGQKDIHPEGGRLQAATQHSVSGGQDRPTGRRVRSGGHLRGGFSRLLVRVPTGARPARCTGRSPRRDLPEASEL